MSLPGRGDSYADQEGDYQSGESPAGEMPPSGASPVAVPSAEGGRHDESTGQPEPSLPSRNSKALHAVPLDCPAPGAAQVVRLELVRHPEHPDPIRIRRRNRRGHIQPELVRLVQRGSASCEVRLAAGLRRADNSARYVPPSTLGATAHRPG
jgi:hypothetical protein